MRFLIGIPIILSIAAFIIAFLALFAGRQPGFMTDYHIVMLNTSRLGQDLIPTRTNGNSPTTTTARGGGGFADIFASATAAVGDAWDDLVDELDDIVDDVTDKLAEKLGIKEFYTLNVQNICEGDFSPNATSVGAWWNVTKCSEPLKSGQTNVSAILDHELSVGKFKLSLASLQFPRELQQELDKIPALLLAVAILFILGVAFSGLSMIFSIAALFLHSKHPRSITLLNLVVSLLGAIVFFAGSMAVTIGGDKAVDSINNLGGRIGLAAIQGHKFLALAWSAFALMFVVFAYWAYEMVASVRSRRRGSVRGSHKERKSYSMESARR